MSSRSEDLRWVAIQMDDAAVLLRAYGLTDVADELDRLREVVATTEVSTPGDAETLRRLIRASS